VHQEICETNYQAVRAKRLASAWQFKMSGSFESGVRSVLIQRLGCLVGSVWGNQHLCMQRQDSWQATSTLGNTPNLNVGSQTKENLHWFIRPDRDY